MSNKNRPATAGAGVAVPPLQEEVMEKRVTDERDALFANHDESPDERNFAGTALKEEPEVTTKTVTGEATAGQHAPEPDAGADALGYVGDSQGSRKFFGPAVVTEEFVREQVAVLGSQLRDELMSLAADRSNGLSAAMVGGQFNCPKCGLRIIGPALTSQKGGLYEHPFGESSALGNKSCEYRGQKFKPPIIFLEFATVRPLTANE